MTSFDDLSFLARRKQAREALAEAKAKREQREREAAANAEANRKQLREREAELFALRTKAEKTRLIVAMRERLKAQSIEAPEAPKAFEAPANSRSIEAQSPASETASEEAEALEGAIAAQARRKAEWLARLREGVRRGKLGKAAQAKREALQGAREAIDGKAGLRLSESELAEALASDDPASALQTLQESAQAKAERRQERAKAKQRTTLVKESRHPALASLWAEIDAEEKAERRERRFAGMLSDSVVCAIYTSALGHKSAAKHFRVSLSQVKDIRRGKCYRKLTQWLKPREPLA